MGIKGIHDETQKVILSFKLYEDGSFEFDMNSVSIVPGHPNSEQDMFSWGRQTALSHAIAAALVSMDSVGQEGEEVGGEDWKKPPTEELDT